MRHRQQRPGHARRRVADQRRTGLGGKGGGDEFMAVAMIALQRDKEIAFAQGTGVDRKSVDGEFRTRLAERGGFGFPGGPQTHAAHPPKISADFSTSSRSEKGRTSLPTYCPVSWPLPATTRTSPEPRAAMAVRIASWRSPISRAPGT